MAELTPKPEFTRRKVLCIMGGLPLVTILFLTEMEQFRVIEGWTLRGGDR